VKLALYGTALVQWYVVHSHERHLAGSMIYDEFQFVLTYTLSRAYCAKRRPQRVTVRAYLPAPQYGGAKKVAIIHQYPYCTPSTLVVIIIQQVPVLYYCVNSRKFTYRTPSTCVGTARAEHRQLTSCGSTAVVAGGGAEVMVDALLC
jgi:hypothetical protein